MPLQSVANPQRALTELVDASSAFHSYSTFLTCCLLIYMRASISCSQMSITVCHYHFKTLSILSVVLSAAAIIFLLIPVTQAVQTQPSLSGFHYLQHTLLRSCTRWKKGIFSPTWDPIQQALKTPSLRLLWNFTLILSTTGKAVGIYSSF